LLWIGESNTRMKGATGETNSSSLIFVAGVSSRIGNGFQQKKFSCRSIGGEPRRLVDATGLDTEPFHLASTYPREAARGNLRGGVNKGRIDARAHHVAPQKILGLVDFGAHAGMDSKRGAWVHMACRGANNCVNARRSTARPAKVQSGLVLAL